jgi:transposase
VSQRLASVPGIGVLTATALAATVGEGQDFRNGRQLAAYLGLVPRQASSGGKERLLGISKRGDGYLRSLLIHGARAVIHHIRRRLKAHQPGGNPWVEQLLQRCHVNEVAVALANKMARTAWVLLARNETWCAARPL